MVRMRLRISLVEKPAIFWSNLQQNLSWFESLKLRLNKDSFGIFSTRKLLERLLTGFLQERESRKLIWGVCAVFIQPQDALLVIVVLSFLLRNSLLIWCSLNFCPNVCLFLLIWEESIWIMAKVRLPIRWFLVDSAATLQNVERT